MQFDHGKEAPVTVTLRAALFVTLASASFPAVAVAQGVTTDSLIHRIELLELKNSNLEFRVRELETIIRTKPFRGQPVTTSANARDLQNWRRLRQGMSMDDVRALLGEPERVEGGSVTWWHWVNANVYFIDGNLEGWSEPGR